MTDYQQAKSVCVAMVSALAPFKAGLDILDQLASAEGHLNEIGAAINAAQNNRVDVETQLAAGRKTLDDFRDTRQAELDSIQADFNAKEVVLHRDHAERAAGLIDSFEGLQKEITELTSRRDTLSNDVNQLVAQKTALAVEISKAQSALDALKAPPQAAQES